MKKFWSRICAFRPKLLPSLITGVLFAAASLYCAVVQRQNRIPGIVIYAVYAAAFVSLVLTVWTIVDVFQSANPVGRISEKLHTNAVSARLMDDSVYRIRVTSHLSLCLNILMALTRAVTGIYSASVWLIVLAGYYLVLCLAKGWVLYAERKAAGDSDEHSRIRKEWRTFRLCGWMLIVLTVFLQGVVIKIVRDGSSFSYRGTLIFAVALYDFYCLISSIIYMFRTRKRQNPATVAIRCIRLATSLVAMLSLQTAMFASFAGGMPLVQRQIMNAAIGTCVCLALLVIGILMVIQGNRGLSSAE